MNLSQRHLIRRECIDLAVEGTESDGFALQGKLANLSRDWLAPALDEMFARVAPGDEHWQFERIEVDVGSFTPEAFERNFVAAVTAAVEQQIRTRKEYAAICPEAGGEDIARVIDAQSIHEAFLYFLATGALPWWCHLPEGRTLEAMVDEAWGDEGPLGTPCARLLDVLALPVAQLRLVRQFSAGFLDRLLEHLAPGAPAVLRSVGPAIQRGAPSGMPRVLPEQGWAAVFTCLAARRAITQASLLDVWAAIMPGAIGTASAPTVAHGDSFSPEMAPFIGRHAAEPSQTGATATPGASRPADAAAPTPVAPALSAASLDLQEGIFVACAGVVVLHPFLPILFERLRVCVDGVLVQPDRALALLHFLATGEMSAPEHALALPKRLCGMEPTALAGAPVALSEQERAEAQELLKAAIGHWSALGDTSSDALRGTFLVRPGKLSTRGDDDLLQVESQAYDVLLGQLPWGIGAVHLPWMKRFLWVEWPY